MFRWLPLLLVVFLPLQKRYHKLFRPFAEGLIDPSWNLPATFEKNIGIFLSDIPLLLLIPLACAYLKLDSFWEGEKKYLVGFLGVCLLSIMCSVYPSYGLYYVRWVHLALPAIAFFVIASPYYHFQMRHLFYGFAIMGCFEATIAIMQYFTAHSVGLKWLGEVCLTSQHHPPARFFQPDKTLWLIDHLLGIERNSNVVIRAYGTFPHPNILGGFLVLALVSAYDAFLRVSKVLMTLAIGLIVFALFLTYSRSALFIAVGASTLWFLFAYVRKEKCLFLGQTVIISFALSLILLYPQLVHRGGVVNYNSVAQGSDQGRIEAQTVALHLIGEHPLIGVGLSNYLLYAGKAADAVGAPHYGHTFVHNVYLLVAVETGLIGLFFLMAFIVNVLWKGRFAYQTSEGAVCLISLLALLGLGLSDFYLIHHQCGRLMLLITCGMLSRVSCQRLCAHA